MEQVLGDVFGEHANDGASSPGARSRQRLAPLGAASLPFGVHEPLVIGTRRMKRIDAVQRLQRLFSHAPSPNDAAEVSRGDRLVARSDRCCFACALRRRTIARRHASDGDGRRLSNGRSCSLPHALRRSSLRPVAAVVVVAPVVAVA